MYPKIDILNEYICNDKYEERVLQIVRLYTDFDAEAFSAKL